MVMPVRVKPFRPPADEIVTGDDGYKIYWPRPNGGGFDSKTLREIADELDRLNAAWDADVQNFFNQQASE